MMRTVQLVLEAEMPTVSCFKLQNHSMLFWKQSEVIYLDLLTNLKTIFCAPNGKSTRKGESIRAKIVEKLNWYMELYSR